ncbi:MAG TPA: PQQ-dependent sugar dehydrogenase [Gammaproteobacteria bacterium]|nr:PQQ-dependent sugar dehydrogenase [Gammaproteobacteria bacterium]
MSLVRERTWLTASLAALAFAVGAPTLAQQQTPGAAQPQNAQPPPGVQQQRRTGGGGGGGPPQTQPLGDGPWDFTTEQGRIHVTVVTKGLERPWGMAFLPTGDMLVTERPGRLRIVRGRVLDPTPIAGMPKIRAVVIGGLQDVALHPNFERNRLVYFSYSKPDEKDETLSTLAVARGRFDGGAALTNVEDIFVAKDWYSSAMAGQNMRCCGQGPADASFGARMAFGRDGLLYVASGDRNWGEKAQDPSSHLGKIIRIRDDGRVPRDNPFAGREGYLPEIYTLGHRNPTGLTVNPATGELWSTEFGPRGGDELNRIEAGKNYGWILVTHGNHYNNEPVVRGAEGVPGMTDPALYWAPSTNPGNIAFYTGDKLPGWRGSLLLAAMSRALVRISFDSAGKPVAQERLLRDLGQRFRDVRQGPDGAVYLLTDETAGAMLEVESQSP